MIDLERVGEVFVLRMQAGENRFDGPFLDALDAALDQVEEAPAPRALVTTGAGRFYSNGLDLGWLGEQEAERLGPFLDAVHGLFARLLAFPALTVAAVNGHAFAGGAMLALAHDFRVVRSDRGFFCLPEVDLRLPLQPGMTALIRARLPRATAHEAIVTGRRYGGDEAVEAGFADEARPERELLSRAIEIAGAGSEKDGATLAALKRGLYEATLNALEGVR